MSLITNTLPLTFDKVQHFEESACFRTVGKLSWIFGLLSLCLSILIVVLSFSGVIFTGVPFLGVTIGVSILLLGVTSVLSYFIIKGKKSEDTLRLQTVTLVQKNIRLEEDILCERERCLVLENALEQSVDCMNQLTKVHLI